MKRLFALAPLLALSACVEEANDNGGSSSSAPQPGGLQAEPPGEKASEAATVGAAAAQDIIVAVNTGRGSAVPDALNTGRFRIVGRCLQLEVAERLWTPIFARAATYAGENGGLIRFAGSEVRTDEAVRIGGGRVALQQGAIGVSEEARTLCPKEYFLVASVERL